ncbi:helix-turn-helix domain-containing protein [Brevibacillus fulvus]|uniref:Transcriptional regulator with XRE-family HTH domain n=1 Tax=Brevibacillus fulvus TaxID=1125967 RepID=A0A938XS13_9BACL|nr:helix-turn-helix transcriptional regulator [Brevibacillus fulvus]MBM7589268.1 transcriptional regulator with XRE-family HTH domain [Brevibacillus fulvus]
MNVGDRLRKLRMEKGLSQQQLADQLGLNRSTYARYETNDNQADYKTLQSLADFFQTSVDYLLGRSVHAAPIVSEQASAYQAADLFWVIKDAPNLFYQGEELALTVEEREELLRHLRLAWMMIKERRDELRQTPPNK